MPRSPVLERYVGCLNDAGWDAEVTWSGSVMSPTFADESQLPAFKAAADECRESSGWNRANDWASWTDTQIDALYDAEVANHECFVGIGFDSAEPPSRQQFMDTFHTRDQYYSFEPGLMTLRPADEPRVLGTCPPPTWFPAGEW